MSIYIHIPFCNYICHYCDFCKLLYNEKYVDKYLDSLKKEINDRYNGEIVRTIYIGGGTPSSLNYEQLLKLFDIVNIFNKDNDVEFTIECNIESLDEDKLRLMKENGINRISVGIQSFNNEIISILGRHHTKEEATNNIYLAKKYFDNINIDLIYAVNDDIDIVKKDIKNFLTLNIPHISVYSLIIEDNTILKINNYKNIDEDIDYKMYSYIEKTLEKNNYIHYEISNYAKKGYESKHNLVYWNNDYYYGFGLGSTSYIDNVRMVNTMNLSKYLNGDYLDSEEYEDIDIKIENEIMLGLRKIKGININNFKEKYGISFFDIFDVEDLINNGYLIINDEFISINKKYLYVSDSVLFKFKRI